MKQYCQLVRHPGNQALFLAAELSILAASAGQPLHLHAEGLRGTGKTSVLRAARQVLPRLERVRGCLYNCDPENPHCPEHRGLDARSLVSLGTEVIPMPFLEISHAAKVGTVVGSIDLARLTNPSRPAAALLPGTIPQAHRGIIFVDEINRLAETSPELADILLDAMGTRPGRVQVEEAGLPVVELPVQVTVWAASNPDEDPGPLEDVRRQLADRFDLRVAMGRPAQAEVVEQMLRAADGVGTHPGAPRPEFDHAAFAGTFLPDHLRRLIAGLYVRFSVESLRGVEALQLAARACAALGGRAEVDLQDLRRVAPLVFRHRVDEENLGRLVGCLDEHLPKGERIAGALAQPAGPPDHVPPRVGLLARLWRGRQRRDESVPARVLPVAPWARARPLRELPPEEWVRPGDDLRP